MTTIVRFGLLLLFATNIIHAQRNYRHDCTEGEVAPIDNNNGGKNCTCMNGRWACTANTCDDQSTSTSTTSAPEPVTNCVPDENIDYTDFCGCFCLDGWWACADCLPPTTESPTPGTGSCQEGQTTSADDGCNTCYCIDGTWACTEKFCLTTTTSTTTKICEDGDETSFDGCNKCICMNGVWGCTKIFCQTSTEKPQCKEGQTKFDGCNSCGCNNGIWICTLRACFSETDNTPSQSTTKSSSTINSGKCTPGSSKIVDCDRCFCTKRGVWVCSVMESCNNN